MKIKQAQIEDTVLVCPYCMNEVSEEAFGCCGESSAHFETAYIVDGEALLESQTTVEGD